jgi:transcriptional regulator with XRE-family HTH domain
MKHPNRIRYLRERLGLNQKQLAERMGVNQQDISRYDRGDSELTVEWLHRFAKALGVHPMDLIDQVAMSNLRDEVEPVTATGLSRAVLAIAAKKRTHLYAVLADSVAAAGDDLQPGEVDETETPKTGDIVLVSVGRKTAGSPEDTHRVLRQFLEPNSLVTNRPGPGNLIIGLDDPEWSIVILGVVMRHPPDNGATSH